MTFGGTPATGRAFAYLPFDTLERLASGGWPHDVVLLEVPLASTGPPKPIHRTGLQAVWGSITEWAFIHFFEAQRDSVEQRYGADPNRWPSEWNFGRWIRNAFAHGGTLDVRNPRATPVTWKNLRYTASDHGKQILFSDVGIVEIILLMSDMDAAL